MNNQEEINKRLLKIKDLAQVAQDDPDLKIFESVIYTQDKKKLRRFKHELPWRTFLMPLLHLIQNKTEASNNFWKLLHRWFFEKKMRLQTLDLEDITFILSSLERIKTKKSAKVLEKFKKFTLTNELLDEASPFISSDLILKITQNPVFETNDADISEFIESSSYILVKAIISSFGIEEVARVTDIESFPDFKTIQILDKHKLVPANKGMYKVVYDATQEWLQDEAKLDSNFPSMPMRFGAMSELNKFPSMADFDEVFNLHISHRLMGTTHFDIYLLSLDYLQKLITSREKLLTSKEISLKELAYVIGSKNTKSIRNEFFKKDNKLVYVKESKTLLKTASAQKWVKDSKRKQPIYEPLDAHSFPDLTLDYIMRISN
jgi:hypothetical protein